VDGATSRLNLGESTKTKGVMMRAVRKKRKITHVGSKCDSDLDIDSNLDIDLLCTVVPRVLLEIIAEYTMPPIFTGLQKVALQYTEPRPPLISAFLYGKGLIVALESRRIIVCDLTGKEISNRHLASVMKFPAFRACMNEEGIFIPDTVEGGHDFPSRWPSAVLYHFAIGRNGNISEEAKIFEPNLDGDRDLDNFAITNRHVILEDCSDSRSALLIYPLTFGERCHPIQCVQLKASIWGLVAVGDDFAFYSEQMAIFNRAERWTWNHDQGQYIQIYSSRHAYQASKAVMLAGGLFELRQTASRIQLDCDGNKHSSFLHAQAVEPIMSSCVLAYGFFDSDLQVFWLLK